MTRLSPLVPLLTAITTSLLPALFHLREKKDAAVDVYVMPKGLLIFMWCAAMASLGMVLVPAYQGSPPRTVYWWMFGGWSAVFAASAMYARRYSVRLTDAALEMTEFRTERIPYASIQSVEVVATGRDTHLEVLFNGTERLVISGYISYFDRLASELKARVASAK